MFDERRDANSDPEPVRTGAGAVQAATSDVRATRPLRDLIRRSTGC